MKQKEEDVKRILDRVRQKEITAKEAQKLIKAIDIQKAQVQMDAEWGVLVEKPQTTKEICLSKVSLTEPAADEVMVEVRACSISFGDLLSIKGLYPSMPSYPFVPGFEISGVVLKTGSAVTKFQPGDAVAGVTGSKMGGNSHFVNTSEKLLTKKPDKITFAEACTLPVSFLTIHTIMKQAMMEKGDRVLIHSAAGGLGLVAIQLLKQVGCEVFATAGSDLKTEYLHQNGIEHAVNYQKEDFSEKILEWTHGRGVDVVVNTLPGQYFKQNIKVLADEGKYFELANTGLHNVGAYELSEFTNNKSFHNFNLRGFLGKHMDTAEHEFQLMNKMIEENRLLPVLVRKFDFSQIREAYQCVENRQNIGKIAVVVSEDMPKKKETEGKQQMQQTEFEENMDIAVIGISGRFPGSNNLEEFWKNLVEGKELITEIPVERFRNSKEAIEKLQSVKCRYGGFLNDIEQFDPMFFNISAVEAQEMDPQQRFFLEDCWNALEDAGYANDETKELNCAVFGGTGGSDYMYAMNRDHEQLGPQAFWGNASSVVPARISYLLNLKGPSVAIDTACSSSLVAIHLACQSIRSRESEMAIAGGVFMNTTEQFYLMSNNAGMLSPDGKCKTYDNDANGFVPGEGSGAVVLKPLKKALEDHDLIYGIVKGSLTNQDGKTNGLTAPSTKSQTKLEMAVYEKFHINPESISYVEAHGTGTKLGDPIEIEALTNAFRKYTNKKQYCAIGSVKTNMGHAAQAAGVASFMKVLLALKYKELPPSLNYHTQNEHIHFKETPFYVITERKKWSGIPERPRRTAISSFGFSGTNAHIIVEEAFPEYTVKQDGRKSHIIVLSAKNTVSLYQKVMDLKKWLSGQNSDYLLQDAAYTLSVKRKHFSKRIGFVVDDKMQLKNELDKIIDSKEIEKFMYQKDRMEKNLDYEFTDALITKLNEAEKGSVEERKLEEQLLEQYKKGADVSWSRIFERNCYYTLSMPTYPFKKSRFWYENTGKPVHMICERINGIAENGIELSGFNFQVRFARTDFFIRNHIINGEYIVPGAVYLELAAMIGRILYGNRKLRIQNVIWIKKIEIPEHGITLETSASLHGKGYRFMAYQTDGRKQRELAFRCELSEAEENELIKSSISFQEIKQTCKEEKRPEEFYRSLEHRGFQYGEQFQTVREIHYGNGAMWEKIERKDCRAGEKQQYILHPAILDGLFQGALLFAGEEEIYLPYAIEEAVVFAPTIQEGYGCICQAGRTAKNEILFDMVLYDGAGKKIMQLKGFKGRKRISLEES